MKSFAQLAKSAYTAYLATHTELDGWVNRPWQKLGPVEQACWVAAVKQVVAEVAAIQ